MQLKTFRELSVTDRDPEIPNSYQYLQKLLPDVAIFDAMEQAAFERNYFEKNFIVNEKLGNFKGDVWADNFDGYHMTIVKNQFVFIYADSMKKGRGIPLPANVGVYKIIRGSLDQSSKVNLGLSIEKQTVNSSVNGYDTDIDIGYADINKDHFSFHRIQKSRPNEIFLVLNSLPEDSTQKRNYTYCIGSIEDGPWMIMGIIGG